MDNSIAIIITSHSVNLKLNFQNQESERDDTSNPGEESISMCTKLIFISVSIAVILLFIVMSLVVARLMIAVGEFLCNKTSLNSLPSDSESTGDVHNDHLLDVSVIPLGYLHVPEHIYLLYYLTQVPEKL